MARKNCLAKNLLAMRKYFPQDYGFFPQTWVLPADIKAFKDQFNERQDSLVVCPVLVDAITLRVVFGSVCVLFSRSFSSVRPVTRYLRTLSNRERKG